MSRFLVNKKEFEHIKKLRKEIKSQSHRLGYSKYTGKMTYMIQYQKDSLKFYENKKGYDGIAEVIFYFWGEDDNFETNGMQYKTTETSFWHWTTVEDVHALLFDYPHLEYSVHSITSPNKPKITKPSELRGIKQITSIPYIQDRALCGIFLNGNDVWVKHTDYLGTTVDIPHLVGVPLLTRMKVMGLKPKAKKFIYDDNWGSIVQKKQAWVKISNLNHPMHLKTNEYALSNEILSLLGDTEKLSYESLVDTNMSRFWECVVKKVREYSSKVE